MFELKVCENQSQNACALISVGAIKAILEAADLQDMRKKLCDNQGQMLRSYAEERVTDAQAGSGVTEERAYQKHFMAALSRPEQKTIHKDLSKTFIKDLLDARDSYPEILDFYQFNLDGIDQVQEAVSGEIDWATVTLAELCSRVGVDSEDATLNNKIAREIHALKENAGMTFNADGHVISLCRKHNNFYSFDSASGILRHTDSIDEMIRFMIEKHQAFSRIDINMFNAMPNLLKAPNHHLHANNSLQDDLLKLNLFCLEQRNRLSDNPICLEEINQFQKDAQAILRSNSVDKRIHLNETAKKAFTHRDGGIRLFADAMLLISSLALIGLIVGGIRVLTGHSFFFSHDKTRREQEFCNTLKTMGVNH